MITKPLTPFSGVKVFMIMARPASGTYGGPDLPDHASGPAASLRQRQIRSQKAIFMFSCERNPPIRGIVAHDNEASPFCGPAGRARR